MLTVLILNYIYNIVPIYIYESYKYLSFFIITIIIRFLYSINYSVPNIYIYMNI